MGIVDGRKVLVAPAPYCLTCDTCDSFLEVVSVASGRRKCFWCDTHEERMDGPQEVDWPGELMCHSGWVEEEWD